MLFSNRMRYDYLSGCTGAMSNTAGMPTREVEIKVVTSCIDTEDHNMLTKR